MMAQLLTYCRLPLLLLGSLLWETNKISAQVFEDYAFRQQAKEGLDFTYNMQFEKAQAVFVQLEEKHPEHPAPHYLLAFNRWWQSYISTTQTYHPYMEHELAQALKLNARYANDPAYRLEYTFFQYMIYAFQARLYILQRDWLNGANSGRKALPYLEKGLAFAQESPEFYFSSGIYHYFAETYPRKHSYLQPFMVFFPDGNAKLGVDELDKASRHSDFAQVESLFYLGDIYLEEGEIKRALQVKRKLSRQYPRNTWFEVDYARALLWAEEYNSAREILESIQAVYETQTGAQVRQISSVESRYTSLLMVRVYHLLGRIALEQQASPEIAISLLDQSLSMITLCGLSEYEYLPLNYYYRAVALEKLSRLEEAKASYQKVLELEDNAEVLRPSMQALKRL
ncbi:MAG: tetratricopeptide repeat protein [Bacteroidota bacterium]